MIVIDRLRFGIVGAELVVKTTSFILSGTASALPAPLIAELDAPDYPPAAFFTAASIC
jgi:hypothetical protein